MWIHIVLLLLFFYEKDSYIYFLKRIRKQQLTHEQQQRHPVNRALRVRNDRRGRQQSQASNASGVHSQYSHTSSQYSRTFRVSPADEPYEIQPSDRYFEESDRLTPSSSSHCHVSSSDKRNNRRFIDEPRPVEEDQSNCLIM